MAKWICRAAPPFAFAVGAALMWGYVTIFMPAWATPPVAAVPPAPVVVERQPADDSEVKAAITLGAFTQFKNSAALYMTLVSGVETIRKELAEVHLSIEEARAELQELKAGMKPPTERPTPKASKPAAPPKGAPLLPHFGKKKSAGGDWTAAVRRSGL